MKSYTYYHDRCPICNRNTLEIRGQDMYQDGTECFAYCTACDWHTRVTYPEKVESSSQWMNLFDKFRRIFPV